MKYFHSREHHDAEVAARAAEVDAARANVGALVDEIKTRVRPRNVINEATSTLSAKSSVAAETTRRHLQKHPYAVGFTAALVGLLAAGRIGSSD